MLHLCPTDAALFTHGGQDPPPAGRLVQLGSQQVSPPCGGWEPNLDVTPSAPPPPNPQQIPATPKAAFRMIGLGVLTFLFPNATAVPRGAWRAHPGEGAQRQRRSGRGSSPHHLGRRGLHGASVQGMVPAVTDAQVRPVRHCRRRVPAEIHRSLRWVPRARESVTSGGLR